MTASVLQEKETSINSGTGGNITLAFASAITAGSALHVIATQGDSSTATYTFSDNNGGSYSTPDTCWSTNHGQGCGQSAAVNHASGATSVTITFSGVGAFPGLSLKEIGGVSTTPLDGHSATVTALATSATINLTNANQPALISGWGNDPHDAQVPGIGGTGFTLGIHGWNYGGGFPTCYTSSSKRITTTASQATTFTLSTADDILMGAIIFDEAAATGTVALTGQAATFTAGTLTPVPSFALTGTRATFSAGTVTPGLSEILLGQLATFTPGILAPSTTVALTGQVGTFTPGLVHAGSDVTVPLVGQASNFSTGTLAPSIQTSLAGQAAAFTAGTVTVGLSSALTGSAATFTPGLLVASGGTPINNVFGTIQILWRAR